MGMAPSSTTIIEEYESTYVNQKSLIVDKTSHGARNNGKELVLDALKARIQNVNTDVCQPGEDDAFFVADMGEVYRQHLRWKMQLKRVKPHYGWFRLFEAVKALLTFFQPLSATQT